MASSSSSCPRTVDEIFNDYCARRNAVIRAITEEFGRFHKLCDPGKENLCLYGYPDETWEVRRPVESVTLPEPSPGINFCRDVLNSSEWLSLVALHTNSWLLSVAFHYGARLNHDESIIWHMVPLLIALLILYFMETLFLLINGLPTILDSLNDHFKPAIVSGSKSRERSKRTKGNLTRILQEMGVCVDVAKAASFSISDPDIHPCARTIDEIFDDYCGRRTAVIRALTHEFGRFHELCDPGSENLCLFGHPNETWEVKQPMELVPSTLPDPSPGINFCRDVLNKREWLSLVSLHTNSWLLSVAFFNGLHLDQDGREKLFLLINDLPTIIEVVINHFKSIYCKPAVASGSKTRPRTKRIRQGNFKILQQKIAGMHDDKITCGICGEKDDIDTFWIACDTCNRWFHGVCIRVTPQLAKKMNKYKCQSCRPVCT